MINLGSCHARVPGRRATDMRKGYDGLADLVRHRLQGNPLDGHLYLFCNARRNRVKILCFDGSGLWILSKRLERGLFSWPALDDNKTSVTLKPEELSLLLGGIELERTRLKNWWRRLT